MKKKKSNGCQLKAVGQYDRNVPACHGGYQKTTSVDGLDGLRLLVILHFTF